MCSKHKRKPHAKPRVNCEQCWVDFFGQNPDAVITAKDLHRFFFLAWGANVKDFKIEQLWKGEQ